MNELIVMESFTMTPELGAAFKSFRIEYKKTAKDVVDNFGKASSYLTKLEKGEIKKIETSLFIEFCNFITDSEDGICEFTKKATTNFSEYDDVTKIILMNIDDTLCLHKINPKLITLLNEYINEHNIKIDDIYVTVNNNEDIRKLDNKIFDKLPINEWYAVGDNMDCVIKINIPFSYINLLLNGEMKLISSVIAEAIIYAIYKLGGEGKKGRIHALDILAQYKIISHRKVKYVNSNNIEETLGVLEPDTAQSYNNFVNELKIITTLTKDYGAKKMKAIEENAKSDLGFYFAFMSGDIKSISSKSKETKQEFLDELRDLIEKYSNKDDGIDLYKY